MSILLHLKNNVFLLYLVLYLHTCQCEGDSNPGTEATDRHELPYEWELGVEPGPSITTVSTLNN